MKRSKVGCLLIFLFSFWALLVVGARHLQDKPRNYEEKPSIGNTTVSSSANGSEGFVATINREVPSSPDPLHNR